MPLSAADLVQPQYIGSREGSSIEELQRAATDHGLHTFAFSNGSTALLLATSHPVILHVESQAGAGRYDHFVLYLGRHADKLLILDPSAQPGEPARAMDASDLDLIWDGTGIVISKSAISGTVAVSSVGTLALCGVGIISLGIAGKAGILPKARFPLRLTLGAAGEAMVIVTAAIALPALCALCADSGLLAHQAQIKQIEQTNAAYFLPRISFGEAQHAIEAGSVVFVDARYSADYGAGHLPGAINVPVSSSDQATRVLMGITGKTSLSSCIARAGLVRFPKPSPRFFFRKAFLP